MDIPFSSGRRLVSGAAAHIRKRVRNVSKELANVVKRLHNVSKEL